MKLGPKVDKTFVGGRLSPQKTYLAKQKNSYFVTHFRDKNNPSERQKEIDFVNAMFFLNGGWFKASHLDEFHEILNDDIHISQQELSLERIFEEGCRASLANKPISANPYCSSEIAARWNKGWLKTQNERGEAVV